MGDLCPPYLTVRRVRAKCADHEFLMEGIDLERRKRACALATARQCLGSALRGATIGSLLPGHVADRADICSKQMP
jgi:hypothetical protein